MINAQGNCQKRQTIKIAIQSIGCTCFGKVLFFILNPDHLLSKSSTCLPRETEILTAIYASCAETARQPY